MRIIDGNCDFDFICVVMMFLSMLVNVSMMSLWESEFEFVDVDVFVSDMLCEICFMDVGICVCLFLDDDEGYGVYIVIVCEV